MRDESPARALTWMATGAAVLAVGAFLGAAAGQRQGSVPSGRPRDPDLLEELEMRVQGVERPEAGEPVDAIWSRLQQLEERLEQVGAMEMPPLEVLAARVEDRLAPRLGALEGRVQEHQAAIQDLRAQAAQAEGNLQKLIAAVEKLAEQISRSLPPLRRGEPASAELAGAPARASAAA